VRVYIALVANEIVVSMAHDDEVPYCPPLYQNVS